MRILFLSLSYLPSRRASSVQVMRMCGALARRGHDVTLIAKRGAGEPGAAGDHAFYGVPASFAIVKLARPARRGGGVVFTLAMARELLRRRAATDLVYSRDLPGAWLAARLGLPVALESHGIPDAAWLRRALAGLAGDRRLRGLVAISEALRADLGAAGLLPRHAPVVVAHDAADPPAAAPARPPRSGPPRIGYVGNLYPGRGVELVVELARRAPAWQVHVVGGSERDLARWRARPLPPNLVLAGFVAPARLAEVYAGLDVVLMPYARTAVGVASGASDTSRWCSPMKMFEYMASGAPIVASDLPVLQEVLVAGETALIAPAGDVAAWQAAVQRLLDDPALASRLAAAARERLIREHTWDMRAARVLAGLGYPGDT